MLDAGRAPELLGGLIVFFDHADEHLRYVAAEVPRIARRPDPMISLVLFRGLEEAGGLLQLESTLSPREEQLEAVRTELAARGLRPRLVNPDWRSGTVEVAGWLEAEELAPLSLVLGTPSLVGPPTAVLAARLDRSGAALAQAALRGDSLPTVVVWSLETLGLAGPLGIEVEADLQAIHDRLTAEGALRVPIGQARIAKTWEEYLSDNLVRVRIHDESGDVEGRRSEALRRVGEDLTARMFRPFPPAERPPQLNDEQVAQVELSFRLTMRREEVEQTRRWSFTERRAVPVTHYAAASLLDFLGGSPASEHITFADLEGETTREIVVRSEPELDRLGLSALEVDLDLDGDGEAEDSVALTDERIEERVLLERKPGQDLRYRARARFNPDRTRAEDAESAWIESPGDLVVASARRLFPARDLTVMVGGGELDWLDHVEILVAAPGEPERTLRLEGDRRMAEARFPGAGNGPVSVRAHWRGGEGEPELSTGPFETEEDLLVLDSPFGSSIRILAVPLPLGDVVTMTLELRHEHDGFRHERSLDWEGDDRGARKVGLRRLADGPRRYEHRVTSVRLDGSLVKTDWIESEEPTLVLGAEGPTEVYTTEVVLLGGGPAARGSLAVEVTLAAGDLEVREVLEGETDAASLTLVAPEGGPAPTVKAVEFFPSGDVNETEWPALEPLLVLAPPPAVVES